jgi:hypothetical protein
MYEQQGGIRPCKLGMVEFRLGYNLSKTNRCGLGRNRHRQVLAAVAV